MTKRGSIVTAALVALLQVGFLGWMIQGRAAILRDGREVLLRVQPVDPRDLLRGDYVVMSYLASEVPAALVTNLPADYTEHSTPVVVRLEKASDGYWMPVAATIGAAIPSPPTPEQIDIAGQARGESTDSNGNRVIDVSYGIERYYVPEGEGRAIEEGMNSRAFGILAAVDASGAAQIKGLMDGDKMLYAEPLY